MTFNEYAYAMSVMDGTRCVAVAKRVDGHGWKMVLHGGCWTDARARTQGIWPGKYPHLMMVKNRKEARTILQIMARI
jgi:hypothetical protein